MNKILITGVNGFVGNYLYNQLSLFNDVYGLDLKNNTAIKKMIVCDITQIIPLNAKLQNLEFDIVIHCAALAHNDYNSIKSEDFFSVNVTGTKNLILALSTKKIHQFYFLSTISVYGEYGFSNFINENFSINPKTDYSKSKAEAEKLVSTSNFTNYYILRMPVIHSQSFLKDIYKRIITFKVLGVYLIFKPGNGKQINSFCYIKNLNYTITKLIETKDIASNIFNIADSYNYTTNELINYYLLGKKKTLIITIPKIIVYFLIFLYKNKVNDYKSAYWKLCMNNIYSTDKIKKLGFKLDHSIFLNKP